MTFSEDNVIKQAVKPCEQREQISRGTNDNMRTRIQDEFTRLPISRQRKYQLRFPNETTGYCAALEGQLTQLLGPDSVEVRAL